ncbi:terpenoid synthase [Lenzites betulinus]|nr:terpenoid synthase [Lenzites betulinus]
MLLHLPDTLARWPWQRRISPWHEQGAAESNAWLHSFSVFAPPLQAVFDRCKCDMLAGLVYGANTKEEVRSGCDIMNLFFVIDDQTDEMDAAHTQELVDIVLDAMQNPEEPRPQGEAEVGEMARQFWVRASACGTASGKARFMEECVRYLHSVVEQARDRDEGITRTSEEYFALRRLTAGVIPCCVFAAINLDIPLEVTDLPIFQDLHRIVTEIVMLDNDLFSFRKEYAAGDLNHNIIPLVMHERKLDVQSAISWLAEEHARRVDEFLQLWPKVSTLTFGSDVVDCAVAAYLDHVAHWPRANVCWCFEGARYFGEDGPRVKKERTIELEVKCAEALLNGD